MAILSILAGNSGSGKSASLENLNWDETFVIKPNSKPFPFRSDKIKHWDSEAKEGHYIQTTDYGIIKSVIEKAANDYGKKVIIIEDSTHLLLKHNMDRALEKGYDKYTESAMEYYNLMEVAQNLPDDVLVFMVSHLDLDQNGEDILKIIGGKFIQEKISPETFVTVALKSEVTKDGYKFKTQSEGNGFFKSPKGMFEDLYIDNDLNKVVATIRDYYGMNA